MWPDSLASTLRCISRVTIHLLCNLVTQPGSFLPMTPEVLILGLMPKIMYKMSQSHSYGMSALSIYLVFHPMLLGSICPHAPLCLHSLFPNHDTLSSQMRDAVRSVLRVLSYSSEGVQRSSEKLSFESKRWFNQIRRFLWTEVCCSYRLPYTQSTRD
jgi:hypothetical protein